MQIALSMIMAAGILSSGFLITYKMKSMNERLVFPISVSLGILALGALGLVSYVLYFRFEVVTKSIWITSIFVIVLLLSRNASAFISFLRTNFVSIFAWISVTLIATLMSFAPVNKPVELYDGPYVFKTWSLPVKIQAFSMNYPPDNAIPAVVTEFLANDIDFKDERPIMPGQEFANRPILASFAALPLRLILGSDDQNSSPLDRFDYVGISWPDTLSIVSDREFRIFLSTAIPLNASLAAITAWLFMQLSIFKGGANRKLLYSTITGFVVLNPFLMFHAIFTWPKNVAAMFIITSLIAVKSDIPRKHLLGGILMGLAYWSHPMTMPFIFVAGIYIFFDGISKGMLRKNLFSASKYLLATVSVIVPWILWTNVYMKMPFDLIAQNATPSGSLIEQIGVRMNNIFILSAPTHLNVQPMEIGSFLASYMTNLWNPLGLLMLVVFPALYFFRTHEMNFLVIVPTISALLITLLHAFPAPTIIHGWQAAWPGLLLACFSLLSSRVNLLWKFVVIQLVVNSLIIGLWILKFTAIDLPV
jgi:hypothetical protein